MKKKRQCDRCGRWGYERRVRCRYCGMLLCGACGAIGECLECTKDAADAAKARSFEYWKSEAVDAIGREMTGDMGQCRDQLVSWLAEVAPVLRGQVEMKDSLLPRAFHKFRAEELSAALVALAESAT